MVTYYIASYAILIANFFYNSGSEGPTIYLFFLSFQLLIAFTETRQHKWWAITHVLIIFTLLGIEYYLPQQIPFTYQDRSDRFFDLGSSALIILLCMYCITIYLRSNYVREKQLVSNHAALIEEQNQQIRIQNEQLTQLNREKSKILSVLAHDLRGPMHATISVLELLHNYPVPEDKKKELLYDLLSTTRNTSDMVHNLLTWSSNQMGGLKVVLRAVRLLQVAQQVLQQQQELAQSKQITLRMDIDDDAYVTADPGLLELIIRNLLNNAIKFTPEHGVVSLSAIKDGPQYCIRIKDSGIGMTSEQLEMLFSLDIHSTYGTNNEKGIGLGLVLCNEFVVLQNGSIQAESRPGQGSTFYLYLPVFQGPEN